MGGPRRRVISIPISWHVERTPAGIIVVRDQDGFDVFKHPDPFVCAMNKWLASAAPAMKLALQCATKRHSVIGSPYWRDDEINHLALVALGMAIMPSSEIVTVSKWRRQAELDLEAA